MRQFDLVKLSDGSMAILLQADLLDSTQTRVVAPLILQKGVKPTPKLHPTFEVSGKIYLLATEQLGAVFASDIKKIVGPMKDREWDIRRALDLVFVGV
jgi:toxin CcdB